MTLPIELVRLIGARPRGKSPTAVNYGFETRNTRYEQFPLFKGMAPSNHQGSGDRLYVFDARYYLFLLSQASSPPPASENRKEE